MIMTQTNRHQLECVYINIYSSAGSVCWRGPSVEEVYVNLHRPRYSVQFTSREIHMRMRYMSQKERDLSQTKQRNYYTYIHYCSYFYLTLILFIKKSLLTFKIDVHQSVDVILIID